MYVCVLAETVGFEPTRAIKPCLVSSEVLSATQPRLRFFQKTRTHLAACLQKTQSNSPSLSVSLSSKRRGDAETSTPNPARLAKTFFFCMYPETWFWTVERLWEASGEPLPQPALLVDQGAIGNVFDGRGRSRTHNDFLLVDRFEPQAGDAPVFFDEDGTGYRGLKNYFCMLDRFGRPVWLIDNHQLALVPLAEINTLCGKPLPIVHIDAHRDDAEVVFAVPPITPENVAPAVLACRVSDYLDAAQKGGIADQIIRVTQSSEFEGLVIPSEPFVLNLDLDIFGLEGSAVDLRLKLRVIRACWQQAAAIILATSPGFIDQKTAFRLACLFSKESSPGEAA